MSAFAQWTSPQFKADEPSRHDVAKQKKADADATWKAVCKVVDARDGKQCRCCDQRSDPDATGLLKRGHRHHIVYRSAGGKDTTENLVTLCADCHNDEHQHRMIISGATLPISADGPLIFMHKGVAGDYFISREEMAVRQVRRD